MPEHDLVEARDYTPDGQRHCDGCGQLADEGGFSRDVTLDTGAIATVTVTVKASPFRGEDLCRNCVMRAVASVAY